jgi:hypothetical protein
MGDNIKIDLKEISWGVNWIGLLQDRNRCLADVNRVINRNRYLPDVKRVINC